MTERQLYPGSPPVNHIDVVHPLSRLDNRLTVSAPAEAFSHQTGVRSPLYRRNGEPPLMASPLQPFPGRIVRRTALALAGAAGILLAAVPASAAPANPGTAGSRVTAPGDRISRSQRWA